MMIAGALQATARWSARTLGRESFVVWSMRPAYETLLECFGRGRNVHWTINGVTFHVDPRHRRQLSTNYDAPVAAFLAKPLSHQRNPLGAHCMVCREPM